METVKTIFWIICAAFFLLEGRALLRSILSTFRVSKWMKKKKRNDFSWKTYFLEDWKQKSIVYRIYQWLEEKISFQLIMARLWYINNFSKDEFHPWLSMEIINEMSPKQRRKYLAMLEKIRYKKDILKT